MNGGEEIDDTAVEIWPDHGTGTVVQRYIDPSDDSLIVEIHVLPEIARELAYNLTKASLALEMDW